MIDLLKNKLMKYPLFSILYFSQGVIYGLATVILPVYFNEKGIPYSVTTAIIALAYIPWVVKFIFGGLADYFILSGRRKFIVLGGVISSISFIILSFIDPEVAIIPFAFFTVMASMGIVFLDVSADGWAIEISDETERGKVHGAMFGGLFIGMAVTSIAISSIAKNFSYSFAFIVAAIIVLFIAFLPLFFKENITVKKKQKMGKLLKVEFKKKNTQIITIFSFFSAISFGLLAVLVPLYINDVLHLDIAQVGLIAAVGPIATVIGNVVGGFTADHWGRKKSLYLFLGLNLIFAAGLVFANDWQRIAILWGIVGFLHGGHYSAVGALWMDVTNPKVGASQYSILASFTNAGEMGGTFASGTLVSMLGFGRVFLYSGWIYGPALIALYLVKVKYKKLKS